MVRVGVRDGAGDDAARWPKPDERWRTCWLLLRTQEDARSCTCLDAIDPLATNGFLLLGSLAPLLACDVVPLTSPPARGQRTNDELARRRAPREGG